MKLEKMDAFFEARLDGYGKHMLTNIESAGEHLFAKEPAACVFRRRGSQKWSVVIMDMSHELTRG